MLESKDRRSLQAEVSWAMIRVLLSQALRRNVRDSVLENPIVRQKVTKLALAELGWSVVPSDAERVERFEWQYQMSLETVLQNLNSEFAAKAME